MTVKSVPPLLDNQGNYIPVRDIREVVLTERITNAFTRLLSLCGCEDINTLMYNNINRKQLKLLFRWMIQKEFPLYLGMELKLGYE